MIGQKWQVRWWINKSASEKHQSEGEKNEQDEYPLKSAEKQKANG